MSSAAGSGADLPVCLAFCLLEPKDQETKADQRSAPLPNSGAGRIMMKSL